MYQIKFCFLFPRTLGFNCIDPRTFDFYHIASRNKNTRVIFDGAYAVFPNSPLYWRALFDVNTVRDDMAELAQGELQICGICIN